MQKNAKSSAIAGVLGVFLGACGAHDWYLGNTKKAITHVSLFVGGIILLIIGVILTSLSKDIPVFNMLFYCLVIMSYVIVIGDIIWGFIEGIIILMQGDAGLAAKGYQVEAADTLAGIKLPQPKQPNTSPDQTTPTTPDQSATPETTTSTPPETPATPNTPVAPATPETATPTPPVIPKAPDFKASTPIDNPTPAAKVITQPETSTPTPKPTDVPVPTASTTPTSPSTTPTKTTNTPTPASDITTPPAAN